MKQFVSVVFFLCLEPNPKRKKTSCICSFEQIIGLVELPAKSVVGLMGWSSTFEVCCSLSSLSPKSVLVSCALVVFGGLLTQIVSKLKFVLDNLYQSFAYEL